jgi:hypothetical protein
MFLRIAGFPPQGPKFAARVLPLELALGRASEGRIVRGAILPVAPTARVCSRSVSLIPSRSIRDGLRSQCISGKWAEVSTAIEWWDLLSSFLDFLREG